MTKILYAESENEYVYLKSAKRKLGKHSDEIIRLLTPITKKKVNFPSDKKVRNRWKGY